jgi:hypothetical protein
MERLMSDQLLMFSLMTLEDSPNATSLQELQDGRTRSDWQDGMTKEKSGRVRAPANHLASPAREKEPPTSGIYGLTFTDLLPPADQRSLLANRLVARLAMVGSTESDLTWKVKDTPAKDLIFRLAPSTRRTSGSDCIGWRTPATSEPGVSLDRLRTVDGEPWTLGQRAYDMQTGRVAQVGLTHEILATWSTPTVQDSSNNAGPSQYRRNSQALNVQAAGGRPAGRAWDEIQAAATWPTPTANDHKGSGPTVIRQDGVDRTFQRLDYAVEQGMATWPTPDTGRDETVESFDARVQRMKMRHPKKSGMGSNGPLHIVAQRMTWPTPQANKNTKNSKDPQRMKENGVQTALADAAWITDKPAHGTTPNGSQEPTEKRGALNPEFVSWLMGFPPEWDACAPTATPSSRRSRQKS